VGQPRQDFRRLVYVEKLVGIVVQRYAMKHKCEWFYKRPAQTIQQKGRSAKVMKLGMKGCLTAQLEKPFYLIEHYDLVFLCPD